MRWSMRSRLLTNDRRPSPVIGLSTKRKKALHVLLGLERYFGTLEELWMHFFGSCSYAVKAINRAPCN